MLRKNLKEFIPRTVLQPLLLVFVFTYVFPKIGQGVGGGGAAATQFSSVLVAGVVATAILFQGIQAVALPLVQEFGYTREIEDRVLAPLPVQLVAFEKIVAGGLQCLFAGLIVFPIATVVPATPVHLDVNWLILLTLIPLACIMSGALGLFFGTAFEPRTVPMLFGVILIPITFLGCTYYSWLALEPIRWLQIGHAGQPARVPERGLPGRAHPGAAHVAARRLPGRDRLRRPVQLDGHPRLHQARHRLAPRPFLRRNRLPERPISTQKPSLRGGDGDRDAVDRGVAARSRR